MLTKSCKNVAAEYFCKTCYYTSSRKSSYNKHLSTAKHKSLTDLTIFNTKVADSKNQTLHTCIRCSKTYKSRVGLWYHEKKCSIESTEVENICSVENSKENHSALLLEMVKQNKEFKELIVEQNKQNQELTKQLIELSKESKIITNNTNSNNSTINKFNLNFFLHEQCKDAINITDFVSSLTLQLNELEEVGKLGYVEGISKIFIRGLKELDVYKRPIHCSDLKREVLYVKDQDIWEKENEEKEKIQQAIHRIAHKNIQQIPLWKKEYPESKDVQSNKNDEYLHIIVESMGGKDDDQKEEFMQKIIKNVAKEVIIGK